MTYSISIAEAAENDIRDAFLWYEDQKNSLGTRFEEHVSKTVYTIQTNPLKTQIRYGNTRVFFMEKFPYGIHFRVDEALKSILIVAVFHIARDSEKWKIR